MTVAPTTTTLSTVPRSEASASEPDPAIEVRGLRRTYGQGPDAYEAVRRVDLDVPAGSITALLGTNGAGKTSTLEVIEGLAPATEGRVRVLGLDPLTDRAAIRRRSGVLLQRSGFSGDLTVRETLQLWSGTLAAPRPVDDMVDLLALGPRADVRMAALSGGETRRVDLACTLMGGGELLVLDEPTTGLDPESRREIWRLVSAMHQDGATVLITTHYLEEAEAMAERLEIMHEGRIVRSGSPTEIAEGHPSTISFATVPGLPEDLPGIARVAHDEGRTTMETEALQRSLTELLAWAARERVDLDGLDARSPSLESVFLAIADGRDPAPDTDPDDTRPAHDAGALR